MYGSIAVDTITNSLANTQSTSSFGFTNRLIDAGFIINQRGYVSGTSLTSGSYGHDRWKGGASGGTYTFTQGSLGVPITITITAGSLQQVIEGCNVSEGGTYTLSWTGTAQGRINGGTYSSSPLTVTGVTAGANMTIEFNTGTLFNSQLEYGSFASTPSQRPYGTELALCQRYFLQSTFYVNTGSVGVGSFLPATMRTIPTVTGAGAGFGLSSAHSAAYILPYQTTAAVQTLLIYAEL